MRKIFVVFILVALFGVFPCFANAAASAPNAGSNSAPAPVTLSPDQARTALAVLNDPARRAQIQDTLRAVAAAGALATPVAAPRNLTRLPKHQTVSAPGEPQAVAAEIQAKFA